MVKLLFNKAKGKLLAPWFSYSNKTALNLVELTIQTRVIAGRNCILVDVWSSKKGEKPPVRLALRPRDARALQTAIGEVLSQDGNRGAVVKCGISTSVAKVVAADVVSPVEPG